MGSKYHRTRLNQGLFVILFLEQRFTARIRRCASVHTPGGYPSPRFFPRSLVPGPFGGYPSPRFFPRSLLGGTPVIAMGYPILGYPQPGQDGVPPSSQVRMGYASGTTSERALATRQAVCLLRSRRRTFLFYVL